MELPVGATEVAREAQEVPVKADVIGQLGHPITKKIASRARTKSQSAHQKFLARRGRCKSSWRAHVTTKPSSQGASTKHDDYQSYIDPG